MLQGREIEMTREIDLAIIGGSGLYSMATMQKIQEMIIQTPFGLPSAPILVGELAGKQIAFLARHGHGHHFSPSEVPYKANIFALKSMGVERILSVNACGSLRDDYAPGSIVIPDQLFDHTTSRARSFFGEGFVAHASVADPFCPDLSSRAAQAAEAAGLIVHKGGTLIIIEGPRFSTKAESNAYRSWGMSIIGMTAIPEAFLAREAEICYTVMAHVTDYDVWHVSEAPVNVDMVVQTLKKNTQAAQGAIENLVAMPTGHSSCTCCNAMQDAFITQRDSIPPATLEKLGILVKKYLS
jgi:5'-methylthioadenosine phosphorylase